MYKVNMCFPEPLKQTNWNLSETVLAGIVAICNYIELLKNGKLNLKIETILTDSTKSNKNCVLVSKENPII